MRRVVGVIIVVLLTIAVFRAIARQRELDRYEDLPATICTYAPGDIKTGDDLSREFERFQQEC